ncbi:MAG: hypothetical protein JOY71_15030 [Acetobacteraceae bacterium]|nr:hypothetical protein [Acetobacteraceae bacterium]
MSRMLAVRLFWASKRVSQTGQIVALLAESATRAAEAAARPALDEATRRRLERRDLPACALVVDHVPGSELAHGQESRS